MKKYSLIAFFYFCVVAPAIAQTPAIDSLQQLVDHLPDDTAKVSRLNDLVGKLQFVDPVRAAAVVKRSIDLSALLHDTLGLVIASRLRGVLYIDKMSLDSGKLFYDKAWQLAKGNPTKNFRKQVGLLTHNYGVIFHLQQQYEQATENYLAAAKIYREIGEEGLLFFPYNNLSNIYAFLGDCKRSLQYATEAHTAAVILQDPNKILIAINTIGFAKVELKQFDGLLPTLRENLQRGLALKNMMAVALIHKLIGRYFLEGRQLYDSCIFHFKESLAFSEKINNQYEIAGLNSNIGFALVKQGAYDEAVAYLKKAIAIAKPLQLDQVVYYSLGALIDAQGLGGRDTSGLYKHFEEYLLLKDSLAARNNHSQLNELEAKYQAEKKETQIRELQAEKKIQVLSLRQKNVLNYILIGGTVALLIIFGLFYRNRRQKQKLQQQRISELETQQQLTATEAVLKGEEQERSRLAKDLHDGLGGMLSGIKYSLNTMKTNLVMTPDNQQAFERSMDMLDSSIKEMRLVAHNMMPQALVNFGLEVALKDFCNDINQSGAIAITYQSIGLQGSDMNQTVSIAIYRIVQELINNILKHAAATTALVQVSNGQGVIAITVEDDGKGFDTVLLQQPPGIGWGNIRSRVDFLKGKLDVQSQPGKGTSVHIELTA